jgi:hypothetical protein
LRTWAPDFGLAGSRILTKAAIKGGGAMATQAPSPRFALRPVLDRELPDGAWWPQSRSLGDQLGELFDLWPTEAGRIVRVLYSPPDWDDHPRSVAVSGRRVKTGSFPHDDTHELTLALLDGQRRTITVIPPETPTTEATGVLDGMSGTVADQDTHH